MPSLDSTATVTWKGGLANGSGTVDLASGAASGLPVSWPSRTEAANGQTSPEELIAGAHAACYSMALSHELAQAGATPGSLDVTATATFMVDDAGPRIASIHLQVRGKADGIDADGFARVAEAAKQGCPVSRALADSVDVTLDASLA
jgi:osmotically inducible protein OsmC